MAKNIVIIKVVRSNFSNVKHYIYNIVIENRASRLVQMLDCVIIRIMPKKIGNIHWKVCSEENIELADKNARKHKSKTYGVVHHDKTREFDNYLLQIMFSNLSYTTSPYSIFKIYEPKEREIYRLPYFPDRIAHHALMNILEPIWVNIFTKNTYSCIKNRGIHKLAQDLKFDLKNFPDKTTYCLKMDIRKFYPSVNHDILKEIVRKKIKDKYVLQILDEIIDSAPGVPIGNYLSQYFANLYLAYFDHWIKEEVKCKFYYRYADDIVILSDNKDFLHNVLCAIKLYLHHVLKLDLKPNYQVFPVEARGIDFVGYVFKHGYTNLRKSLKQNIMKLVKKYLNNKISREKFYQSMSSYQGWLRWCDSKNLANKIQKLTGFRLSTWSGDKVPISNFYYKNIHIFEIIPRRRYFEIHCKYRGKPYIVRSQNQELFEKIIMSKHQVNLKIIPYVRSSKNIVDN